MAFELFAVANEPYTVERQTLGEYFQSMGWELPPHKQALKDDVGVRVTHPGGEVQWTTMGQAKGAGIRVPDAASE